MDLEALGQDLRARFDEKTRARETAIPTARRSIRASANAIRAIHRGEFDLAKELIAESWGALSEGLQGVERFPDVRYAGYLLDAEKEYAEAHLTFSLIAEEGFPPPRDLGVGEAPYLNGIAEAIGEGRRHVLDLMKAGEIDRAERVLMTMEDLYGLLVTMDYPDAITMNLRRSTDVARSLIEKTRGDLSVAFVQRELRGALDRHARLVRGDEA
jgi:translin